MDVRALRNFLVLAEHLHFGEAATAVGTSQPALSQQIRVLEKSLGVELFERTKRRVRLTPAGLMYRADVVTILERLEAANENAREAQRGRRGELVIGASSPAILSEVPRTIGLLRRQFPDVAVQLKIMRSRDLFEEINARTIHVGFARRPLHEPAIHAESLWDHPFRILLPADRPLAERKSIRLADLHGETLISYRRALIPETYDQVISLANALGFEPARIHEVTGIEPALGLIASGFGVAILPAPWERTICLPEIAFRPIEDSDAWRFRISLCWHQDEKSALANAFIELVRAAGSKDAAPPR